MSDRFNRTVAKMMGGTIGGQSRVATTVSYLNPYLVSIVAPPDEVPPDEEFAIAFTSASMTQNNSRGGSTVSSRGGVNWYKGIGETPPFANWSIGFQPLFDEDRFTTFLHGGFSGDDTAARQFTINEGPGDAMHLYVFGEASHDVYRIPLVPGYAATRVLQNLDVDHGISYIDSIEQPLTWGEGYGFIVAYGGGGGTSSVLRWDRSLEVVDLSQDLPTTQIIGPVDYENYFAWVRISRDDPGFIFLGGSTVDDDFSDVATIWKYTEDGDLAWQLEITSELSGYPLTSGGDQPFQYITAFCEVLGKLVMFLNDESLSQGSEDEPFDGYWRVFTLDLDGTNLTDITDNCTVDGMTLPEWYNSGGDDPGDGQMTSFEDRVIFAPIGFFSGDGPEVLEGTVTLVQVPA